MGTDIQKITQSFKLHITHQMKLYSNVKTIGGSITCFSVFEGIGKSQGNLAQMPEIMGRDSQKTIKRVKPHISNQMKPCSRVKAISELSST